MEGCRLLGLLFYSRLAMGGERETLDPRPWVPALLPAPKAQTLFFPLLFGPNRPSKSGPNCFSELYWPSPPPSCVPKASGPCPALGSALPKRTDPSALPAGL